MTDLAWKLYRIGQLSRMIREQPDEKKAKRYARTLRQTAEEVVALSMAERPAAAAPRDEGRDG